MNFRLAQLTKTLVLLAFLWASGCETIKNVAFKVPQASIADLHLVGTDFQSLALELDLDIDNPNPMGATLEAFSYQLQVGGQTVITGEKPTPTKLKPGRSNQITVPMKLNLADLTNLIPNLMAADEFDYEIGTELFFKLPSPLGGSTGLPLKKKGKLPILRPPSITNLDLNTKDLKLTGAELELSFDIKNPNAIKLDLDALNYAFQANGQNWASGKLKQSVALEKKGQAHISFPIKLSFLAVGRTAFQLLSGNKEFDTNLKGSMTFGSSLPFLQKTTVPLDYQQSLRL